MSWENEAKRIIKAELARQGVTYAALAKRLQILGVKETERSIANKLSRGTFSFVYYLQCMRALEIDKAVVDVPRVRSPRPADQSEPSS